MSAGAGEETGIQAVAGRSVLTLAEVGRLLGAEVLCGDVGGAQVGSVGAADMMSDVLALSKPGMLLLTGLVSAQVIRTAIVADLCGVVFVRGRRPGSEVRELASKSGVPVLCSPLSMFEAAGILYTALSGR